MYYSNASLKAIIATVVDANPAPTETVFLLFGEKSDIDFSSLIEQLNKLEISFCGGIFPGIIHGTENYTSGYLLKKLPLVHTPWIVHGLNAEDFKIPNLTGNAQRNATKPTILTFVDGLTSNIASYLNKLFHHFGDTYNFLGGGAGSLTLVQQPCIFSNEGIFKDAALICLVDMEVSLGVQHGWKQMLGPFVATKTEKNIIYELNWMNAFEVYKDALKAEANVQIGKDNFFDIAKGYPFGIFKENGEDIVRDPIAVGEEGELICVGEIPANTVLYILKGDNESLIDSAEVAIKQSINQAKTQIAHTFIVDCISRTLFLEQEFSKELGAINNYSDPNQEKKIIPQGVLSLGEISSNGEGFLEFYNKTLVIGALYN